MLKTKILSVVAVIVLAATSSAQSINVAQTIKVGDVIQVIVSGGTPGTNCTLDWDDGGTNSDNDTVMFDGAGEAVFTITVPNWAMIVFSIDPNDWQDDVTRFPIT